jgi:hypothetical protein
VIRAILCISFITGLTACNDPAVNKDKNTPVLPDTASKKTEPVSNEIVEDTVHSVFGCYYKMDDKYSETQDTAEINKWWRQKLTELDRKGIRSSLFSNKGPGPSGAEWNPSTELFVAAAVQGMPENEKITLELNKKKITGIKFTSCKAKWGSIVYFQLPFELWKKDLRNIKAGDLQELYNGENLDTLKKYSAAPLETGQVVEITLSIKGNGVFTDFLHAAYGE